MSKQESHTFTVLSIEPPYKRTDFLPCETVKNDYIIKILEENELADNSSHTPNISYTNTFAHLFQLESRLKQATAAYNKMVVRAIDMGFYNPLNPETHFLTFEVNEQLVDDETPYTTIKIQEKKDSEGIGLYYEGNTFSIPNIEYIVHNVRDAIINDLSRRYSEIQTCLQEFEEDFPGYLTISEKEGYQLSSKQE